MSPTSSVAAAVWRQLPFFVWLVALWMLLWGQFTVLAAVTGLVVALVVTRIFRLPPVELSGRVNLWYGAVFIVLFWLVVEFATYVNLTRYFFALPLADAWLPALGALLGGALGFWLARLGAKRLGGGFYRPVMLGVNIPAQQTD